MIQKVEMYTVICDNCKKDIGSEQEFSCWNDDSYAVDNALDSDWVKVEDKHYCESCYSYDDSDNFILDLTKTDKYLPKG